MVVATLTSNGDSFDVKSPAREYLTKKLNTWTSSDCFPPKKNREHISEVPNPLCSDPSQHTSTAKEEDLFAISAQLTGCPSLISLPSKAEFTIPGSLMQWVFFSGLAWPSLKAVLQHKIQGLGVSEPSYHAIFLPWLLTWISLHWQKCSKQRIKG